LAGETVQHAAPQMAALTEGEAGIQQHSHRSKRPAVSLDEPCQERIGFR